ncbi:MAG: Na/Pi cotransporter family protein [Lachnospiraceae bacterium]|jgi:phosphate:Na+ symporter|nr:Na/Pi cotransporter family protein [Lachnospiraceae bacterium]
MDFFDLLTMTGGLALFLYGMHLLSEGLEKISGGKLERILENLTNSRLKAVLLGAVVTAVIQSSSATTVMVVGFVNSGIMKLSQAVGVIMGANVGTTITSWVLSLAGIESGNFFLQMVKPTSFSPVLAMTGVILIMFLKNGKKRDTGMILVGFAILMTGMDTMSQAMKPLSSVPWFTGILTMFSNPVLGVLAGALITAVIQSSSASVGILQALCATGSIYYATAVPVILGQNIGTCVTAMMSGVGAGRNARRASIIHLLFNIIGAVVFMAVFYSLNAVIRFEFMNIPADRAGIAFVHTGFNLVTTLVLLPFAGVLEKLSFAIIKPDEEEERQEKEKERFPQIEERFLEAPSFALEQAHFHARKMAEIAQESLSRAAHILLNYDEREAQEVERLEALLDRYDDEISGYLVKLSGRNLNVADSRKLGMLLHSVGDWERIGDHAMNLTECAREMKQRNQGFSQRASGELKVFSQAVMDIVSLCVSIFQSEDAAQAKRVEAFEETIDILQREMKRRHMRRLGNGKCTAQMGFILSDITNDYERIADHCSNLAIHVMQLHGDGTYAHEYIHALEKGKGSEFDRLLKEYLKHYELPEEK